MIADAAYRLVTLGRLALLDAGGLEEPTLTTRRRKLALLAYLALRRRPIPRAALVEVFWGERDEERARKSLSDALSHLRRVLGPGLLATYASDIALAPDALPAIDALELERAAAAGDHARVVALYDGPFLHGFFIDGSSAFEDWSSRERRRLEDLFVAACAATCRALAQAGDDATRATVAARWLDARPDSADAAVALLDATRAEGTPAAWRRALDEYERLRQRLHRDYEVEPDAPVRAIAAELEAAMREQRSATAHSMDAGVGREATVETSLPPDVVPAPAPPPSAPRRRRVLALAGGLAAAMTLLAAGLGAPWSRSTTDTRAVDARPDLSANRRPTVVIAPFMSATEDSTSVWLGDALPGLIAAKLAHFEQVEIVPVEQVHGTAGTPAARARAFGAGIVASGAVTRRDSTMTLDLTLHAADGRLLGRHVLQQANVLMLADLAAVRVLNAADVVAEGATLGELETSNLAAYRHYHLAIQAGMKGEPREGVRQLDAAIALDSGFVAALLERYRMAVDYLEPEIAARLRPALRRARIRMAEGDRLRFDAEEALFAGDAVRAELLARTLVERYPHSLRANGTYLEVMLVHGKFAEAEAAYARPFALIDSATTPEWRTHWCGHLSGRGEFRRVSGNTAGAVSDWKRVTELCPDATGVWSRYSWALLSHGDVDGAQRAADRSRSLAGAEDRWLVGRIMLRQRRWEAIDSVVERWSRDAIIERRGDALDLHSASLRERGRYRDAIALEERGRRRGEFWLPQVHTDNLSRAGEFERLRRFRAEFLPGARGVLSMTGDTLLLRGEGARGWTWHRALYGDAIMRTGDTATVRALADSMAVIGKHSYYARDWRVHHHLRGLLAARAGRHEEAVREFREALWAPAAWTRTNVELARSYLALGQPDAALAILRPAYGVNLDAMGRYATVTELDYHMALAFRAAGQRDSARVYESYVRRAWAGADASVAPLLRALDVER